MELAQNRMWKFKHVSLILVVEFCFFFLRLGDIICNVLCGWFHMDAIARIKQIQKFNEFFFCFKFMCVFVNINKDTNNLFFFSSVWYTYSYTYVFRARWRHVIQRSLSFHFRFGCCCCFKSRFVIVCIAVSI